MTLVKICGIRDPETAVEAAKAGADMIGLMFAESRRKVTPQQCYDICEAIRRFERRLPAPADFQGPATGEVRGLGWFSAWSEAIGEATMRWRPLIVGVFADQSLAEVNDIADAAGLDLVQLSGGEDWDFARKVQRPVLAAMHVGEQTTPDDLLERAQELRTAGLMLDTASKGARGGTGQAFNWEIAREFAQRVPFLLAGGLSPENVADAVTSVEPWGVDVSTGVETDGVKDVEKIRAFIRAAKGVHFAR
ncbi:MAG: phosphoribosylanthranilate isomerase [Dehalococcoidia bacterium]